MGEGGEFDLIRELLARWGARASGIGDDAALIDLPPGHRLVASVDSAVDEVHFRRGWLAPREIGYRATAAALSDLAAMAAHPVAMLIAFAIPADWLDVIGDVAEGIGEMAEGAGATIAGGNLTRSSVFSITTTVLGSVERPLQRVGARLGDRVYVTGRLGGPAAALRALSRGLVPDEHHRIRFARPLPRLREARWLADRGATAAVDISDGLHADVGHLAAASGVRLAIALERLPVMPGVAPAEAAASGEEFELVVTAAGELDTAAFEREFGIPLTAIGDAVAGRAGVDATLGGERVARIAGHDHFSR